MQYTTPARFRTVCRQLWGDPQSQRTLAPGVVAFSTGGHGGIIVSTELFALDPRLTGGLFGKPIEWTNTRTGETVLSMVPFEEDVDWAGLIYCHPELLAPAIKKGYLSDHVTMDYVRDVVERWEPSLAALKED